VAAAIHYASCGPEDEGLYLQCAGIARRRESPPPSPAAAAAHHVHFREAACAQYSPGAGLRPALAVSVVDAHAFVLRRMRHTAGEEKQADGLVWTRPRLVAPSAARGPGHCKGKMLKVARKLGARVAPGALPRVSSRSFVCLLNGCQLGLAEDVGAALCVRFLARCSRVNANKVILACRETELSQPRWKRSHMDSRLTKLLWDFVLSLQVRQSLFTGLATLASGCARRTKDSLGILETARQCFTKRVIKIVPLV
jgi:hypothetical protein